jgi:hypothetical protein
METAAIHGSGIIFAVSDAPIRLFRVAGRGPRFRFTIANDRAALGGTRTG